MSLNTWPTVLERASNMPWSNHIKGFFGNMCAFYMKIIHKSRPWSKSQTQDTTDVTQRRWEGLWHLWPTNVLPITRLIHNMKHLTRTLPPREDTTVWLMRTSLPTLYFWKHNQLCDNPLPCLYLSTMTSCNRKPPALLAFCKWNPCTLPLQRSSW